MKTDVTKVAGAFLIGGLAGAAIAFLYAPKSGRETRRDISKAARRIQKNSAELVEDTIESISDFADEVKEKVTDIIEQGTELSDRARKEIVTTFEQSQKAVERQKKRLTDALGL